MKTFATLIMLFLLAACSNNEKLAACKGPAFALNTGHWQPSPADLQLPRDSRTQ